MGFIVGIYLTITMALTSCSILFTIMILQIHHVGPRQRKVPKWIRYLAFDHIARYLCIRGIVHNFVKDEVLADMFPADMSERPDCHPDTTLNNYTYIMELAGRSVPQRKPPITENGSQTKLELLIATELRRNATFQREKEKQRQIGDEWRLLAIIIDRLLFWLYIVVTVLTSIGILLFMPVSSEWFETRKGD